MRAFLLLLLLPAACLEQSGLQCPPNTSIVGQYALGFTGTHDAGECIHNDGGPDGGPLRLTLDDAGVKSATVCVGTWPDGGTQLNLLVAGKGGARTSDLLPDGGFLFANAAGQTTACGCEVTVEETFGGYLRTAGPFVLRPDGGLPPITGITGTLADGVTGGTSCACNLPCTVTYSINGTLF
jgi:hypothetical protein